MSNYAKVLTRDYLEYLGITEVSEDGTKIMKGDKELVQHFDGRYKLVTLYDPAIRHACPNELKNAATGQIAFGVHRIVYCWYNRIIPEGFVTDHKNSNKIDNRLENLQLLTPKENLAKERPISTRQAKCQLDKPRSFYEDKLAKYEAEYEAAKEARDAKLCHKFRANISNIRARLRYWDAHQEEREELEAKKLEAQKLEDERRAAKKQSVKDRRLLTEWKEFFRERGNKKMWKEVIRTIKAWDTLDSKQKNHVFEILHKTFGSPWGIEL